ncbi:MAG: hypothetical protein KGN34_06950 [Sphingomonadales bacterium]|nr:hypothetical protein [Sphingomonadales bacterium]
MRWIIGLLAGLAWTGAASAETVGNAGVIALHRAGLAGEAIAAKVRGGPCDYDISTAGLIALRKADVPQAVIVAVIERCNHLGPAQANGRHAPGLFLVTGDMREVALHPAAQSSIKVTGNGSILFPSMARLVLPQPAAQATGGARPSFLFAFPENARSAADFGEPGADAAQSPNEFSLVRFRVDGGVRQVTIGRVQPYVEISGIDPKNTLPFAVSDLGGGMFRVEMPQDLPPGQYGFILMGERERRKGTLFRIYDFGVGG